jgi:cytochrome P450
MVHRETTTDLTIAGTYIPKGTALFFCPAVANTSPKIWGPTADEFHPERWESLSGDAASPYAFEPFINGPRICIGKHFALLEMKVMLIEIISKFRFGPLEGLKSGKVEVANPSLTFRPKGGMKVVVERL